MKEETSALIRYRMDRALETIEEASVLFENSHLNTTVNRLYYACFYAVTALLLTREISSVKHSGIRTMFHQHFIKSREISPDLGMFYDLLFDNRQKGDYADFIVFQAGDIKPWIDQAKEFIRVVKACIDTECSRQK